MMKRFLHILLVSVCVCIPAQAEVIISQVFYDTPLNEEINRPPYSNGEFIELHNTAPFADTIAGWSLHGGGKTEVYEFPNGTFVPANGYLIVAYRHNATPNFLLDSLIAVPDSCQVLYQRKIVLSNSGENLALYNAVGERVDTVHYTARQAANDAPITIDECRSIQRIAYSCDQTGQVVCRQQDWHADLIHLGAAIPQQTWLPSSDYYSPELPLSADNPYLISVTPRSSVGNVTVSDGQATLTGGGMAQVSVDWCNPLGKPTMQMMRKQSPSGKNLVTMTQNMGFETRQWLPIPVESDDMLSSESFSSVASTYHQDAAPYVSTNIEQTFHGRPTATTKPGDTYQAHPTQELYGINVGGEIKRWQVGTNSATRDGYYQGGTLRKYTHTDEDGKSTIKYVNPQGQTILLRIANDAETHYIYDYLGRLRYVLPPLCSNAVGNSFTDETEKIKQYAYIYKYDDRGNCIYKKLPGCEPIYMVYDKAGRQVLSQDGNQRGRGDYWTMASYTEQGQFAFTAEVQLANSIHNDLIQYWNTESDTVTFSATGQGNAYFGYITDAQIEQPLVVNYYDNYDFLSLLPTDIQTNLTYSAKNGYGEQYANSTGLLTGKRVYSLADNSYTTTAYYYDADGNIIQQRSTIWNGVYDIMWAAYNFDGTVSRTLEQQPNATEAYWYEYDMSGRLLRTRYQLNDEPVILLSNNTYTELGQQDTILRHNDTDITSYDYDLRGNTTHISSGDFSEQITYAKNGHGYNGTISATTLTQGNVTLQWDYQYDSHNRLSSAQWSEGEDTWEAEKFTYDPMGNILTLKRRNRETLIDDLNYSYAGNQLKAISDAAGEQSLYDQKEYFDYSNAENTMNYDANGNLLADFDRKICTIQYNLLNLPAIIQFCNGNSIVNTYNAEGVKLSSTYYTLPEAVAVPVGEIVEPDTLPQAPQTMTVQYFGHVEKIIIGDSVSYTLHHPEGYITLDALHRVDSWNYFRRDHLGNNVAVWNALTDSTIQRMFYYPSGLPIGISTGLV